MRRRRVLQLGALASVVAVAGAGAVGFGGGDGDPDRAAAGRTGGTVRVTRGTLVDAARVAGTLDHGPEVPVALKATGTVTWLPAKGTVVSRGQVLARVDDRPVVLLYGELPMYRELGLAQPSPAPGATAPTAFTGRDVKQLETNLQALGYKDLTVDETFTAATTAAVKRWQKDLGRPQTGVVGVGDVVYAPGPARIAGTSVRVGADAHGDVLTYTSTTRQVTVQAPATGAAWAVKGVRVTVALPDGRSLPGAVSSVGAEATAPAGQESGGSTTPTVPVVIDLADESALGDLTGGPVTVTYVIEERKDVLMVPVSALVALAEGGYGLELADGTFIAVETGLFADGNVEVRGTAVREGLTVRVPA